MSFDLNALRQAKFKPRQGTVDVPELVDFFAEGTKPVFTIRMLTSNELHLAENAVSVGAATHELLRKIRGSDPDKAAAAAQALGITQDDIEGTLKKQMEMLQHGVIDPVLDMPDIAVIAEHYPVVFKKLWMEITRLTGLGAEATVKRRPSGSAKTSKTP